MRLHLCTVCALFVTGLLLSQCNQPDTTSSTTVILPTAASATDSLSSASAEPLTSPIPTASLQVTESYPTTPTAAIVSSNTPTLEQPPTITNTTASTPTPSATATPNPTITALGQIGFIARENSDSVGRVFTMFADGSGLTQLTTDSEACCPTWSPDGNQIAFIGMGGNSTLYRIDLDGGPTTQLLSGISLFSPAWSPNGHLIAFSFGEGEDWASIYSLKLDDASMNRLTWSDGEENSPAWSPDGRMIAFSKAIYHKEESGPTRVQFDIHLMDADGKNMVRLTNRGQVAGDIAWSPDGTMLAFACVHSETGMTEICVINVDGSDFRYLTHTKTSTQLWHSMSHPSWSPDGRQIAFECTEGVNVEDIAICIMNSDGSGIVELTKGYDPAWQPKQ